MLTSKRGHVLGGVPAVPKKRIVRHQEAIEQAAVVAWCLSDPDWMVMATENAKERRFGAARDVALGMKKGCPDLWLDWRGRDLWLEMKTKTGELSDDQISVHEQLRKRGKTVLVGYGREDAIQQLERFKLTAV